MLLYRLTEATFRLVNVEIAYKTEKSCVFYCSFNVFIIVMQIKINKSKVWMNKKKIQYKKKLKTSNNLFQINKINKKNKDFN